jgi:hypothetical protein
VGDALDDDLCLIVHGKLRVFRRRLAAMCGTCGRANLAAACADTKSCRRRARFVQPINRGRRL